MVTGHGRTLAPTLAPVAASHVRERRAGKGRAVWPAAGQHVVLVGFVGAAIHGLALLVQRRLFGEVVVCRMQLVDIPGDHGALGVLPGAGADSIACIDELRIVQGRSLGAQVGTPGAVTGARGLRQGLAMPVCALEAAEVCSLAGSDTRDEEGHSARSSALLGRRRSQTEGEKSK